MKDRKKGWRWQRVTAAKQRRALVMRQSRQLIFNANFMEVPMATYTNTTFIPVKATLTNHVLEQSTEFEYACSIQQWNETPTVVFNVVNTLTA
jgi:hypothetical protein